MSTLLIIVAPGGLPNSKLGLTILTHPITLVVRVCSGISLEMK